MSCRKVNSKAMHSRMEKDQNTNMISRVEDRNFVRQAEIEVWMSSEYVVTVGYVPG